MEGTKLEILTKKLSPNKINSFWYHGDVIARVQFPNGKKLYAESAGELEVWIDGDLFVGVNAVVEATKRGYTDVDIEALSSNDAFRCGNWFVIIMVDINEGAQTLIAKEITLDPALSAGIVEPDKGKLVTRKEYNAIVAERMKEMGANGQGGFQIRMGAPRN
jgi:hypothetical protein